MTRARTSPRTLLGAVACLSLAAAVVAAPATAAPSEQPQRFIVTVADAYDSRAVAAEHRRKGADIDFVYAAALNGFAGAMSEAELGELQRDRRVTRIERDGIATTSGTQGNATWGLDRIDQRSLPLTGSYSYASTGTDVTSYIIDTGIRTTHAEFAGRVTSGYDAVDGGPADDCNGHGTHVAGTVGGTTYGVAKAARLVAVRVLDCAGSGTWSGVIAGMDWVTANAVKPAVANMSLGGGGSASVDDAVRRMVAAGVTTVVAAGNGNQGGKEQDACGYSPARVKEAVTIGATTSSDAKTSWSNYGDCVDFFAPGAGITSAWHGGDTQTNTISGTSMAAPHVAGAAARYLEGNRSASPLQVGDALLASTTKGIVTSSRTVNNHLLFSPPESVAPGTITGTITSSEGGAVIEGATVTAGTATTSTGADGTYSLVVPPGPYDVTASAAGHETGTKEGVNVTTGSTTSGADIELTRTTTQPPSAPAFELSATAYKVKGFQTADLTWNGSTATSFSIFRSGVFVATVAVSSYTDSINAKGGGSYTYQVCEGAASDRKVCSNEATVGF